MNVGLRKLLYASLLLAASTAALLFAPRFSQAQTQAQTCLFDGYYAGFSNLNSLAKPYGWFNTGLGSESLELNLFGYQNTAVGCFSLNQNTSGFANTAVGSTALYYNTTGTNNTATGDGALGLSLTGSYNTAVGSYALYGSSVGTNTGSYNTATGYNALTRITSGTCNTATGNGSLASLTNGYNNTAAGYEALAAGTNAYSNSAFGYQSLKAATGYGNTALGFSAGSLVVAGDYNIHIGNVGTSSDTRLIKIGAQGTQEAAYIAGIHGVTASGGVEVYINPSGQLGTVTSSRRFKKEIRNMGAISSKLMQLRPVSFRYKKAGDDGSHPIQYGLIAEDVAKIYPELVQYDKAGKPFTIYYHLLTPMLLNELQKAHRGAEAQKAEIAALKTANKTEIAALKSALQSQSAELAALKQSQQRQITAIEKLTALEQASQNRSSAHNAAYVVPR